MKKLCIILLFWHLVSYGQTSYHLPIQTGEDTLIGVYYGIYNLADTSFVKGGDVKSGDFVFKYGKDDFLLKINSIAFGDTLFEIKGSRNEVFLDTLHLDQQALDAFVLESAVPMFEESVKGYNINVKGTPLADAESVFDVLKQSPQLHSPDGENIELIGKGRPQIYMDRQRIDLMEELKAMPASMVQKIEIITNSSARYPNADQNGVVEIYTDDFHMKGMITSVNTGYGNNFSGLVTYSGGLSLNAKTKKWSINSYLYYNNRAYNYWSKNTTYFTDESQRTTQSSNEGRFGNDNGWGYLRARYEINDKLQLTLGANMNMYGSKTNARSSSAMYLGDTLIYENLGADIGYSDYYRPKGFALLRWETDTLGSEFKLNVTYQSKMDKGEDEEFSEVFNASGAQSLFTRQISSNSIPNGLNINLDGIQMIDSLNYELSYGIAANFTGNQKTIDVSDLEDGDWSLQRGLSNQFSYKENVLAAYLEMGTQRKKWGASIGLRGERTDLQGYSQALDRTIVDSVYYSIFPNASVLWKMAKNFSIRGNYGYRISRPDFDDLDPFKYQVDTFYVRAGNPYLLPKFTHDLGVEFSYKMMYSLSLNYQRSFDGQNNNNTFDEQTFVYTSKPENINYEERYSVNLNAPIHWGVWRAYNYINFGYNKYYFKAIFNRSPLEAITMRVYSGHYFTLPHDFRINCGMSLGQYQSANYLQTRLNYSFSCGLSKSFMDNRLYLAVEARDLFPRQNQNRSYGNGYYSSSESQYSFTYVKLNVRFKFGRLKAVEQVSEGKSSSRF